MKYPNLTAELMQSLTTLYGLPLSTQLAELSQGELKVLGYLAAHEAQEVLPGSLSTALSLTTARIAAALGTLEKKAFVQRHPCEEDKRKTLVSITKEGHGYLEEKQKKVGKAYSKLIKSLGKKDTKELIRIANCIVNFSQ